MIEVEYLADPLGTDWDTMIANSSRAQVDIPGTGVSDWDKVLAAAACWSEAGDSYFPVGNAMSSVPAGAYRCLMSQSGPYLKKMPVNLDNLLSLPDENVEALLVEFRKFWTLESLFAEFGFLFKRGIFMHGPPGAGKTSAIWRMAQAVANDHGGVILFLENPEVASILIHTVRRIEPARPIVTVMEDLDALIKEHGEHGYLALLDGETQVGKVFHIATTNYPELLDRRFTDRPSRFDTVMKVAMPSPEARRAYLLAKMPGIDPAKLGRWVKRTDNYSIAHLREVVIAVCCFEQDEEAVFRRLDVMRTERLMSDMDGERQPVGFGSAGLSGF